MNRRKLFPALGALLGASAVKAATTEPKAARTPVPLVGGWQPLNENNGIYSVLPGVQVEPLPDGRQRVHINVMNGQPGGIARLPFTTPYAQGFAIASGNWGSSASVMVTKDGGLSVYGQHWWLMGTIDVVVS